MALPDPDIPDPLPELSPVVPEKKRAWLSPLNQRRWRNFRRNRRAFWSLIIFAVLFGLSLFAEFIANNKPILVKYQGEYYMPIFQFYPETAFGGDLPIEAQYQYEDIACLIVSGGVIDCYDDPEGILTEIEESGTALGDPVDKGWMIWPIIPYRYDTIVDIQGAAPSAPDANNWLGTDDTKRDVVARVIYGFRLSIAFTLIVTISASLIGILAGAVQGYFGGWLDLVFQRLLEIWSSTPSLYVIIIMFAIFGRSFWMLVFLTVLFGWPALVGVVRAEFLRARNFEYVRAARALGVSNRTIMFRHMLPNAMVATVTLLPFIITGTISTLAGLDFLGYGLPSSAPSLGELTLQAKQNLQAPWLAFTAFFTFAIMLSLLVFIFEGVRDAFDPRKTFA
ncbi:MAG: ABC transporter permease [Silicimonas sp.]|nr:ABC transporter permease [Silicimonas sp.]